MMKSLRYTLFSLVLLLAGVRASACGPYYYDPSEYFMYRISANHMRGQPDSLPCNNDADGNCRLWQSQTSGDIPLEDIHFIVYKADLATIKDICHPKGAGTNVASANAFAAWLRNDTEAAEFLLLAKQCESLRDEMTSPWYYPAKKDSTAISLEDIIVRAKVYKGERFADRYVLQAERAMLSLRRYDDCINYWNERKSSVPESIIRKMTLRYVAGAYYNIGQVGMATKLYSEAGDIASILFINKGDDLMALYKYAPGSSALRAEVEKVIIDAEHDSWDDDLGRCHISDSETIKELEDVLRLCLKAGHEGRVDDPDLWYYTAAFIQHLLDKNSDALWTLTLAEKAKGSQFIKESVRVLKLYLESLGPYNAAYEQKMFDGVKWLESKVIEHLDEGRKTTARYGMYFTKINLSYYYWNDMLRKIVHSGIVPRLMKSGRTAKALAFSNMADNLIFNLVGEIEDGWEIPMSLAEYRKDGVFNDLDYSNMTFSLLNYAPAEDIIRYVSSLDKPADSIQRYLNSRGYTNRDYFYEIIGTRMIRDMRYAEAEKWLGQVSPGFQKQLNTFRDGYFKYDPFFAEKTRITDQTDYKYSFAREMASLEEAVGQTVNSDRKAKLMTRFATGIKNSFGACWALSFYRLYYVDTDTDDGPTSFSAARDRGFARAEKLYAEALAICRDKETAAEINMFLCNFRTVVEQYPSTQTAAFIRCHCDEFKDYCLERKERY